MVRNLAQSPLRRDVVRGRGGIAGGNFVFETDKSTIFARYLSLPGSSGNYASTPDSTAVSITGDIDIKAKLSVDDWTPDVVGTIVAKRQDTGDQRSFHFLLNASTHPTPGSLRLIISSAGSANTSDRNSSVGVGFVDGSVHWVRVTLDVDDGAGNHLVKFWTSNDGLVWTQLGTTVTVAGTISIFNGTAPVEIGLREATNILSSNKIYYVEICNGIDGPVVAKFDATEGEINASSFTSSTGEVWTINGSAQLTRGTD